MSTSSTGRLRALPPVAHSIKAPLHRLPRGKRGSFIHVIKPDQQFLEGKGGSVRALCLGAEVILATSAVMTGLPTSGTILYVLYYATSSSYAVEELLVDIGVVWGPNVIKVLTGLVGISIWEEGSFSM
ncbi:hypothetical protein M422DRAFT_275952 [Sphaerobolus stellatus SS14]|uniref:Uncharacterized protein n=1 Tax=Sphaerobolus stellatus (strain SS14) TaxID=990650 RepID=A0A0C9UDH3_SPHS4|nr:hypothetical protein M422DRAFT_275952 [Sphaerobolus stellatus SS14]